MLLDIQGDMNAIKNTMNELEKLSDEEKVHEYTENTRISDTDKGYDNRNVYYCGLEKGYLDGLVEGRKEEREKLRKQIEDMQITEYSNLHEQRKRIHKNLIDGFTEQLGIMDKEEDELFSLKEIKSIINFIMELEK